jgi:hypothetical protein
MNENVSRWRRLLCRELEALQQPLKVVDPQGRCLESAFAARIGPGNSPPGPRRTRTRQTWPTFRRIAVRSDRAGRIYPRDSGANLARAIELRAPQKVNLSPGAEHEKEMVVATVRFDRRRFIARCQQSGGGPKNGAHRRVMGQTRKPARYEARARELAIADGVDPDSRGGGCCG